MTLPALLLSFLVASLYGVAFYFFFGRGWWMLAGYWLTALIGFAIGQFVTMRIGLSILPIGAVNIVEATVTSLLALLLVRARARQ